MTDQETREEDNSSDLIAESGKKSRRIHPAAIAASILAGVVLILFLVWLFAGSDSDTGRVVPAPQSMANDDSTAPMANQTITLTPEQIQAADIRFEVVGEQLSTGSTETSATGIVNANAYNQTTVMSLGRGAVRRVPVQLGEDVSRGEILAVVFSDEFAQMQSKFLALRTEVSNARLNYERTRRLVAINQPGRSEFEQATKQQTAAEASLSEMRNRYERTVKLVRIGAASREQLEEDNTKFRTAEAELEEARLRTSRATSLLPISPEVRSMNEEALNKLRSSESDLAAMRQQLILFGLSPARIDSLRSASQIASEWSVPAPLSGTVTSRSINVGQIVEANTELMQIADLSSVWVIAQVYERDIGRLRAGTGATITSDAFPDRVFRGNVVYIDPQLDEATRTAKVRVEVANPDRVLKFGMYVLVALGQAGGAERTVPIVPSSAVQTLGAQQVVFVTTADPNTFEMRPVRLGPEKAGRYEVTEGLTVGDKVVTQGSFMLRAEVAKTRLGSEHQH